MTTNPDPTAPAVDPADADGDDSFIKAPVAATLPAAFAAAPVPAVAPAAEPVAPAQEDVGKQLTEADFDKEIAAREQDKKDAQKVVDEAKALFAGATSDLDDAIAAKHRYFPIPTPAQSIQAHLQREKERRLARVNGANAVNTQVGHKVVDTRSALDSVIGSRRKPVPMIVPKQPNA
jgi:hypothetical protein